MRQKVFVLGATGQVGTKLIEQILHKDGVVNNANPTDIIGMANSSHMIVSEGSLNSQIVSDSIENVKSSVKQLLETGTQYQDMTEILDELQKQGHGGEVVIVDVTAAKGENIRKFHLDAISPQYRNRVVTANKNVVSLENQDTFDAVTADHGIYDYNTAVMAGAGAVNFLKESRDNHDTVLSIEGCFSGTLGYITSELEKVVKPFSEIVAEAKRLGYTEPNPWDDLNGLDVARKLLILARTAGYQAEMSDIEVSGFIDSKYGDIPGSEFLEAIKAEDRRFREMYETARLYNSTFKYVASMKIVNGKPQLSVGLQEVPKASSIGALQGTNNIARIETELHSGDKAWESKAPGAGLDITARSVRVAISRALPPGLPRRKAV